MPLHSVIIPRFQPPRQCFINELPVEILEMVFVASVPTSLSEPTPGSVSAVVRYMKRVGVRDYPSLIALVCHRWRAVAHASQALHSFMFVDVEDAYDFAQDSVYYEAYLARSAPAL